MSDLGNQLIDTAKAFLTKARRNDASIVETTLAGDGGEFHLEVTVRIVPGPPETAAEIPDAADDSFTRAAPDFTAPAIAESESPLVTYKNALAMVVEIAGGELVLETANLETIARSGKILTIRESGYRTIITHSAPGQEPA